MVNAALLQASDTSFRAGRLVGRLIFLAVIPVFLIALIYWLNGRSRAQPMTFSHAISRWWIWVVGLVLGFLVLTVLAVALAGG